MTHELSRTETALARAYPPPPWTLQGSALIAAFAVRAEAVAPLIPAPLQAVTLPGGLAMAFLGVARYGPGSTLEYSELIAGVMVRHGMRPGPFITHIAVDSPQSQRGGVEIWYLPKQLWRFEWELGPLRASVRVWDGITLVCAMSEVPLNARLLPVKLQVPLLQHTGSDVALLPGSFDLRLNRAPWQLQLGPNGPLTMFKPVGPVLTTVGRGSMEIKPLQPLVEGA
ncbi:MAG: acetoacetate decarboxylase family protein [Chloroflexaceae bacterium]|jgi:hypothetical protein|nr:acetoacetate decarboxylase family protein [Chloroflexaceae bacterium]